MVEVIVSIAIASIVVLGFTYMNFQNIRISQHNILNLQANLYAMEAMEIAKALEIPNADPSISNWDEMSECGKCHPYIHDLDEDVSVWKFKEGYEDINNEDDEKVFTRWMEIINVEDAPGLFDSKKITVFVEWSDGLGEHKIKVETYVFKINQIQ